MSSKTRFRSAFSKRPLEGAFATFAFLFSAVLAAPVVAEDQAPAPTPAPSGGTPSPTGVNAYGWPSVGPSSSDLGKDINSYLPSSSQPYSGKGDSFDMNRDSGQPTVLTGAKGANDGGFVPAGTGREGITIAGQRPSGPIPEFHVVKQGDTLWDISSNYFQNPWEWPRVWSLNPQVENPHWIYPGDQLRMGAPSASASGPGGDENSAGKGGFIGRPRTVVSGTVFLRDQGYIGDPERDVWGEVVGGSEEKVLFSEEDTIYLQMKEDVDVRLGQRLTIFREVRAPVTPEGGREPPGELVKVYGTVRIDGWDREQKIARGRLIETLDVIERGAKVGPATRRFDVVPPKPAQKEVEARVLSSIYPNVFYGQQQVLFIDKGKEDGLVPGNRLKALRRGDPWRHSISSGSAYSRSRVPIESAENAPAERTPTPGDDDKFPDEIVAELMVVRTEDYSATCIVIEAKLPLETGERLTTIVGY